MKLDRIGCLALMLLGTGAVSCRKPDYFPLRDNQVWRFAATEHEVLQPEAVDTQNPAYTIAVTGSAVEPGLGRVYEVRITRDEEPYMSFFFRKTRTAVFVLPASHIDGLEPTSGWIRFLELPLREGAFWYGDPERSVSFDVLAREDIVVPAGRFRNCYRIRVHAPAPHRFTFWLAPDAGIIRWARAFSIARSETSERIRR